MELTLHLGLICVGSFHKCSFKYLNNVQGFHFHLFSTYFFITDHDQAELVSISICQYSDCTEKTMGDSEILATETFTFTSDSSQFLAQQLISNATHAAALKQLGKVYASLLDVSTADKRVLDSKLTVSFRNLSRAMAWSLVSDQESGEFVCRVVGSVKS